MRNLLRLMMALTCIACFFVCPINHLNALTRNPVVGFDEIVALQIYLPNGVGKMYLAGRNDEVYLSHSPHYQWQFKLHPDQDPWAGINGVTSHNIFGIYNIHVSAYMVRDGNKRKVRLSTTSPPTPYQWRVKADASYPLLEKFYLENTLLGSYWALVTNWDPGLEFKQIPDENMEFVRYWLREPAEIQFQKLNERTGYSEPRTFALDHENVSPFNVEGYWTDISGQNFAFVWWLTDKSRSTLTGTLERYFNYPLAVPGYPDENDWCLKIYPDDDHQWMTENNHIPPLAELHKSKDQDHLGATLIEAELTPDNCIWDKFPWLPISANEEIHYSPLKGHNVNVYGVYCFDYGHGGRPEIHPFDAIWWKDWDYDVPGYRSRWYFGVFHDCSGRFRDNWSKAPRALEFYFPFSLDLPKESDGKIKLKAEIQPEYTNNIITETVFGPDEENNQWHKIVNGPDGKEIDIMLNEYQDSFHNTDIRHYGRQGNTYYGIIKTSVAVGEKGLYFGKIEFTQSGFVSSLRTAKMPMPKVYVKTDYLGREVEGDFTIAEAKIPRLELRILNIHGPEIIKEDNKQFVEYYYDIIAANKNFSASTQSWNWQYSLPDEGSESYWGQAITLPGRKNQIQYRVRLGDPDVVISAKTIDTNDVTASGKIHIAGLKLKSVINIIMQREQFPRISLLEDNLQLKSIEVPLHDFMQSINIIPEPPIKTVSSDQCIILETQNIVILNASIGYFPFRDGQIYGEEESEIAERLNNILYKSEGSNRSDLERIFGMQEPLESAWNIDIYDLQGKTVPTKHTTNSLEDTVELLNTDDSEHNAILLYFKDVFVNDTVIMFLPIGKPYDVNAEIKVQDPFDQVYTQEIKAQNYIIPNAADVISDLANIDVNPFRSFIKATKSQVPLTGNWSSNPWPDQPGYASILTVFNNTLHFAKENKIQSYSFKAIIKSAQDVYARSNLEQRNTLFIGPFPPKQILPLNGSIFRHYPRKTTIKWEAIPDTLVYGVDVEYKYADNWSLLKRQTDIKSTTYTFNFVGAQFGRWRVWAIYKNGKEGPKSPWWEFRYAK